jgi:hypothetical protein
MISHCISFHFPDMNNLFVIATRLKAMYRFNIDTVLFFTLYKNITALRGVHFYNICCHA